MEKETSRFRSRAVCSIFVDDLSGNSLYGGLMNKADTHPMHRRYGFTPIAIIVVLVIIALILGEIMIWKD